MSYVWLNRISSIIQSDNTEDPYEVLNPLTAEFL